MKNFKVLILEDNISDARLLEIFLKQYSQENKAMVKCDFEIKHETRLIDCLDTLSIERFDTIIATLSLPDALGVDIVETILTNFPNANIVIHTSHENMKLALETIRQGAQDYLIKGYAKADDVAKSVLYAIERNQIRKIMNQQFEVLN